MTEKESRKAGNRRQSYVNAHVANRLKTLRTERSVSRADLARLLGISYESIQKYENDKIRMDAGTLYEIAQALRVDISDFYEGCEKRHRPLKEKVGVPSRRAGSRKWMKLYYRLTPDQLKTMYDVGDNIIRNAGL